MMDTRPSRTVPAAADLAIAACFFLSGFSALVFQVAWARYVDLLFGHTIYAVTTVLAAFMGGLALGSHLLGRYADRMRNPLALYGVLEVLVGFYALLLPLILSNLNPLYRILYQWAGGSFLQFSLIRFVLFCLLLLPPTTLMGGTLPVLSRYFARRSDGIGGTVGGLYGLNTLGAVCGTFASGFALIPAIGLANTNRLAAGISMTVGLGTILLARAITAADRSVEPDSGPTVMKEPGGAEPAGKSSRLVLMVYAFSGLAALGYEVIWTRLLIMLDYFDSDTYSFTTMLGTFLLGLSVGSLVASRFTDRLRRPLFTLGIVQVLIGLTSLLSLFFLASPGQMIHFGERSWESRVGVYFVRSFLVMIVPTLLLGSVLPIVTRIYVRRLGKVGAQIGRAYAMNTVGSIVGATITGFVLIPFLGAKNSLLLLSFVSVLLGVLLFSGSRLRERGNRVALVASLLAFGVMAGFVPKQKLYRIAAEGDRLLYYDEGSTATVTVLGHADGSKSVNVDGVPVAGTDPIMLTDQKSLAHLPSLVLENPSSALTVGFGSGGSSWSFCLHSHMTKVRCVEIAPNVIDAAPHVAESNHGIVDSPEFRDKYGVIYDDAKSYLNLSGDRYDVIATDCTDLAYKSNANLYTREYFELCRNRILPGGGLVIWLNITGLTEFDLKSAFKTFLSVYPEGSVWYFSNVPTHYVLLLGTDRPLQIDLAKYLRRFSDERIEQDLAEVGLNDPWKFLGSYLVSGEPLHKYVEEGRINTNENAYLEYSVPRTGSDIYNASNLEGLVRLKQPITPFLTNIPAGTDLTPLSDAYNGDLHLLNSIIALWRLRFEESDRLLKLAAEANPRDPSRQVMASVLESQSKAFRAHVKRSMEGGEQSASKVYNQALLQYEEGRFDEAANTFRRSLSLDESNPEAHTMLGLSLLQSGDPSGATRSLERAIAINPDFEIAHKNLGDIAVQASDFYAAESHYLRATSIKDDYLSARRNLAFVYARSGRNEKAIEQLEHILRFAPNDQRAKAMVKQLQEDD